MSSEEFRSEMPVTAPAEPKPYVARGTRKYLDCRLTPSANNCSMFMSGEEEHLLAAGVTHMVTAHGHKDTPELREQVRRDMRDLPADEKLA